MSKLKSFTLIELIIVIIIFGISSYLVVSNIKTTIKPIITGGELRKTLPSTSILYIFRESILIDNNKSFKIQITNPIVYNKNLEKIDFERFNDKDVLFKYQKIDGIQNSYILESNEGIFVFKPLKTIKVDSLEEAQKVLKMEKYLPTEGNYYK